VYKPSWQITSFEGRKVGWKMENFGLWAQLAAFASWQETKMESAKVAATANNSKNNYKTTSTTKVKLNFA